MLDFDTSRLSETLNHQRCIEARHKIKPPPFGGGFVIQDSGNI